MTGAGEICPYCEGRGVKPRWWTQVHPERVSADGICQACGGCGRASPPQRGWLCGPETWPDVSWPSLHDGRCALVMLKDGKHDALAGTFWRVALVLDRPYVQGMGAVGSAPRWGKDSKGNQLGGTQLNRRAIVSGRPLTGDAFDLPVLLDQIGQRFVGAIQIAGEFPRSTWKGAWTVSHDIDRLVFTSDEYVLDKVH